MTVATLYASNDGEPIFFQVFLFDHLRDFQCDDLITDGDFNLILDLDKDKGMAATKLIPNSLPN